MAARPSDSILRRSYLLFGVLALFGVLVLVQVLRLQVLQSGDWLEMQHQNPIRPKPILATRGSILADDGSVLATTLPFYRIAFDASVLRESNFPSLSDSISLLCKQLEKQFAQEDPSMNYRWFKNKIDEARSAGDRHLYLLPYNRVLTHVEMKQMCSYAILNRGKFKGGLILEKISNKRFYPYEDLARITLGLMKNDSNGQKGIEYAFNQDLRGRDGQVMVQRVAGNVEVPLSNLAALEPVDGMDVQTTLNVNMQDVAYSALKKAVEQHKAVSGVAIVMKVSTGEVKAMANFPENFNYAAAERIEPGSVFKLASVMALLEDGYATADDSISTGDGVIDYYDRKMKDEKPYGRISLRQALEKSSNIGVSKVITEAYRSRPGKFIEGLERTGILSPTSFQLGGEPEPYVIRPGERQWNGATLPWLSIGYNVKITPLQQLAFVNAIANGGKLLQPIVVRQLKHESDVVREFVPKVLRQQICSERVLKEIQRMMEGVVSHGTAKNIFDAQLPIAGKTATTQKLVKGAYQKVYRSSFAGYFPANQPLYSIFVMIDEPSEGEYYGGSVAAPVVKEIAESIYAADMEAKPESQKLQQRGSSVPQARLVSAQDAKAFYGGLGLPTPPEGEASWLQVRNLGGQVSYTTWHPEGNTMPNLIGMSGRTAIALLEQMGLVVKIKGNGKVRGQSIKPGSPLREFQMVELQLAG